ncbi:hypothetical protein Dimus_037451 [Dionaea muscipula]
MQNSSSHCRKQEVQRPPPATSFMSNIILTKTILSSTNKINTHPNSQPEVSNGWKPIGYSKNRKRSSIRINPKLPSVCTRDETKSKPPKQPVRMSRSGKCNSRISTSLRKSLSQLNSSQGRNPRSPHPPTSPIPATLPDRKLTVNPTNEILAKENQNTNSSKYRAKSINAGQNM